MALKEREEATDSWKGEWGPDKAVDGATGDGHMDSGSCYHSLDYNKVLGIFNGAPHCTANLTVDLGRT